MIEGKMGKSFVKTKRFYYQDPKRFHKLLDLLTDRTIEYVNAQIDAGVDAIQLFDSWANILPWDHYKAYAERYLDKLFRSLKSCPRLYYSRGASSFYEIIKKLPIDAISLDWQCNVRDVRGKVTLALQGNLDPEALLADEKTVVREARKLLDSMKGDPGFIFNLGHGVLPGTPERNVSALVDEVRRASNY
jgi:uroporphyrinogen decarboxylase